MLVDDFQQAEAITLTVAQAFNIAYEQWQVRVGEEENSQGG